MTKPIRHIRLTLKVEEEDGRFVSSCPQLGVASCGDTRGEALDNIMDAVTTYLNTLEDLGEIEQIFRDRGIDVQTASSTDEESMLTTSVTSDFLVTV